jgi:hypothetical protein
VEVALPPAPQARRFECGRPPAPKDGPAENQTAPYAIYKQGPGLLPSYGKKAPGPDLQFVQNSISQFEHMAAAVVAWSPLVAWCPNLGSTYAK